MNNEHPEIPKGIYCYTGIGWDSERNIYRIKNCPYWSIDKNPHTQENGYCSFLKQGDWEVGFGLLWDQCKECGINDDWEDC